MLRQPELQLKNQSIFFCVDGGIPVFIWDSIFFDIPHGDPLTDFFRTRFADNEVSMRRLSLRPASQRNVLHNLTTYSARVNGSSSTSPVSMLPLSHVFLSRPEATAVYVVLPAFHGMHQLPEALSTAIAFFKAAIDRVLSLWHLGFTFSESDLENGLFVATLAEPERVFLPLPLSSMLHRENIREVKCGSIQTYLSKLGDLLQQVCAMGFHWLIDECVCVDARE